MKLQRQPSAPACNTILDMLPTATDALLGPPPASYAPYITSLPLAIMLANNDSQRGQDLVQRSILNAAPRPRHAEPALSSSLFTSATQAGGIAPGIFAAAGAQARQPRLGGQPAELKLPGAAVAQYAEQGITKLSPLQQGALCKLLEDNGLVLRAPTSAGKGLVADLFTLHVVCGGTAFAGAEYSELELTSAPADKVIMALPYVALVREKVATLKRLWEPAGVIVRGVTGGQFLAPMGRWHVAVCTYEKAASMVLRMTHEALIEKPAKHPLRCLVVDEVHNVGEGKRGAQLEALMSLIVVMGQRQQAGQSMLPPRVLAMSATLPNVDDFAAWLGNCNSVQDDTRPIKLAEQLVYGSFLLTPPPRNALATTTTRRPSHSGWTICALQAGDLEWRSMVAPVLFSQVSPPRARSAFDSIVNSPGPVTLHVLAKLVWDAARAGQRVLVFCGTRTATRQTAEYLSEVLHRLLEVRDGAGPRKQHVDPQHILRPDARAQDRRSALADKLAELHPPAKQVAIQRMTELGISWHNAGLPDVHLSKVEDAMRTADTLWCLVSTTTLAAGVNFPVQRVLMCGVHTGGALLSAVRYTQIVGRAGRGMSRTDAAGGSVPTMIIIPRPPVPCAEAASGPRDAKAAVLAEVRAATMALQSLPSRDVDFTAQLAQQVRPASMLELATAVHLLTEPIPTIQSAILPGATLPGVPAAGSMRSCESSQPLARYLLACIAVGLAGQLDDALALASSTLLARSVTLDALRAAAAAAICWLVQNDMLLALPPDADRVAVSTVMQGKDPVLALQHAAAANTAAAAHAPAGPPEDAAAPADPCAAAAVSLVCTRLGASVAMSVLDPGDAVRVIREVHTVSHTSQHLGNELMHLVLLVPQDIAMSPGLVQRVLPRLDTSEHSMSQVDLRLKACVAHITRLLMSQMRVSSSAADAFSLVPLPEEPGYRDADRKRHALRRVACAVALQQFAAHSGRAWDDAAAAGLRGSLAFQQQRKAEEQLLHTWCMTRKQLADLREQVSAQGHMVIMLLQEVGWHMPAAAIKVSGDKYQLTSGEMARAT